MTDRLLTRYAIWQGSTQMNVYLDRQGLDAGTLVTLEGEDGEWEIARSYETVRAASVKSHRTWSNNI